MRDLQQAVLKHLQGQREPDGAIVLWKKVCSAFDKGGAPAVAELLDRLAVWPTSGGNGGDEDDSEDGDR